jgi:hypothetical protein
VLGLMALRDCGAEFDVALKSELVGSQSSCFGLLSDYLGLLGLGWSEL